jgi:hypothetical protein
VVFRCGGQRGSGCGKEHPRQNRLLAQKGWEKILIRVAQKTCFSGFDIFR